MPDNKHLCSTALWWSGGPNLLTVTEGANTGEAPANVAERGAADVVGGKRVCRVWCVCRVGRDPPPLSLFLLLGPCIGLPEQSCRHTASRQLCLPLIVPLRHARRE